MNSVRSALLGAGTITLAALVAAGCTSAAGLSSKTTPTLDPLPSVSFVTLPPVTVVDSTTTIAPTNNTPPPAVSLTTPLGGSATTTTAKGVVDTTGAQTYVVVDKDTLFGIAKRYGLTAQKVADFNSWSDGTKHAIFPGDKIKIPAGATLQATTTTVAGSGSTTTTVKSKSGTTTTTVKGSTSTTVKGSTSTTTTLAAGSGGTYVVQPNDYLGGIAAKVGTTVDAIVAANGWSDGAKHVIVPGQSIKLPPKTG